MRASAAFCLALFGLAAAGFAAGPPAFGGRANALGGNPASRGASIRPLGGFAPVQRPIRNRPGTPYIAPFGYSFYVPNYFDNPDAYLDPGPLNVPPPAPPVPYGPLPEQQQPVVINQYFAPQLPPPPDAPPQEITQAPSPAAHGDLKGAPENYYLIAYKNHTIYAALAYWVEDKTLHYVTTQNTHNQASLDLIDLAMTKSLNQSRDVPFSLPGQ